jgi:hypothetical protein
MTDTRQTDTIPRVALQRHLLPRYSLPSDPLGTHRNSGLFPGISDRKNTRKMEAVFRAGKDRTGSWHVSSRNTAGNEKPQTIFAEKNIENSWNMYTVSQIRKSQDYFGDFRNRPLFSRRKRSETHIKSGDICPKYCV